MAKLVDIICIIDLKRQLNIRQPEASLYRLAAHMKSITNSTALYWNGQLVWTPALGLYLCVGASGTGDCVQRDLSPTFLRRRHQRQTLAFL